MVKGRFFALTELDAHAALEVVLGTLNICFKAAHVLFDSSSSQSFTSPAFANILHES